VPVGIVVGRLLDGLGGRPLDSQGSGNGEVRIGQPGLKCRCGAADFPVEMPERQCKLDRERKQRQPRAGFHVFSEPVHPGLRLNVIL
jgi:hypothetical protein